MSAPVVALCGNPNVGKSTFFNAATGLHQHTGNWTGKTVGLQQGQAKVGKNSITLVDVPGTYSLRAVSEEERLAADFITGGEAAACIVVCDGSSLQRSLPLALQIIRRQPRTVVCVNLLDEAQARGLRVDTAALSQELGVPVVGAAARQNQGVDKTLQAVWELLSGPLPTPKPLPIREGENEALMCHRLARELCSKCVNREPLPGKGRLRLDRLLTGPLVGIPAMVLLLGLVFFLTLQGANYPSALLEKGLLWLGERLRLWLVALGLGPFLVGALVDGVYSVSATVTAVMLPPMAIFFPLFTLLEDLGYLPRVAFNLDRCFCCCHACGKQALTMCMGYGCNAVVVTGCRIIDSRRERLLAVLTNSLTPCNGRLPAIFTLLTVFFGGGLLSLGLMVGTVLLSVGMTFLLSWLLSKTLLKGQPSAYTLELPPFRRPQVGKVLLRSLLDRTARVLLRAVTVAAPCGLLLYLLQQAAWLSPIIRFFDGPGELLGLDGATLSGFLLGLPANEIVLPITLMGYEATGALPAALSGAPLGRALMALGWGRKTAICFILFSLFHFPCSTTLLTIRKETGSWAWTALSALLPTLLGTLLCGLTNLLL